MKVIVTGGSGFIGRALIPRLLREGHEIVLLSRNPAAARARFDSRVAVELWDGVSSGRWEGYIDGADAVINFAGEPLDARRWSRSQKERIVGSRVNATSALVGAIARSNRKPSVLISASGVGYYGPVREGEVTEGFPRGSDFLSEVTSLWEDAARGAEASGVRTVILRIAVVLGDDGGALRKMVIPFKMFVGGVLGAGQQWFPWIHRDDLVEVIMFALLRTDTSGVLNVVAPESVTMRGFCATLGRVLRRPSWASVPAFVLKTALGEMSGMILTGQKAVPKALEYHGYRFKFPQLEPALRDIVKRTS